MVDRAQQYEAINRILQLPTYPVAVKYFASFGENREWELVEQGFYRPKDPLNICQLVGLARHHGRMMLATAEDMACKIGALAMGMYPFDEEMQRGEIAVRDGVRKEPEQCRVFFEALPRIEYEAIKAIAFAPFHKMSLDPDQVILYGNPLQVLRVVQAYLWSTEPRLNISTCGKYGVCVEAMASSYLTRKPSVGFPCRGERTSSIVQDHEIFICVPMEHFDVVLEGLEKTRYLLPSPMPFSGIDQSPYYLPDYYLTEEAKDRMDQTKN